MARVKKSKEKKSLYVRMYGDKDGLLKTRWYKVSYIKDCYYSKVKIVINDEIFIEDWGSNSTYLSTVNNPEDNEIRMKIITESKANELNKRLGW